MPTSNVLITEPDDVYHAKSSRYLTSHGLADFRRCPQLYHKKKQGLITEPDRPAYIVGRAAHALILEGTPAYRDRFAIGGPINPRTGSRFGSNTKAFAEWAATKGKPVLTDDQALVVEQMAASVNWHEHARALLDDGDAEQVVRVEYLGMEAQGRLDWIHPEAGLVDLKTCDDLDYLEHDARRFGYLHQMAFYRSLLFQATERVVPVHLIAVEKKEPYRCGVWRIGAGALAVAQHDNEQAISRLRMCTESDHWPTGYEDVRVLEHL